MSADEARPVPADPWAALRRHTPARIALGRTSASLPTHAVLDFGLDHARARDAVHQALDLDSLERDLRGAGHTPLRVHSAAPDRATYLTRPDLGRRLDQDSARRLAAAAAAAPAIPDIVIAIADGLSALAVQQHVAPLLAALRQQAPERWSAAPLVLAVQGRVALGDEIGALLRATLAVVMLGERPGLSSPDSLGLYMTWQPRIGRNDAERNCVSNVRPQGLSYAEAARKLDWLVGAALARGVSGIALKDQSDAILPADHKPPALEN